MPPRRSHTKSRAGCRRCKARKIKCDEIRPRCHNCDKHGVTCDYEFPESLTGMHAPGMQSAMTRGPLHMHVMDNPPIPGFSTLRMPYKPSLAVSPSVFAPSSTVPSRMLELRLMHHYVTSTCKTLNVRMELIGNVWQDLVPRIAMGSTCGTTNCRSSHLMDAIMAVSALHLRCEFPRDEELVRASHAYMASSLGEYNRLLQGGINAENAEALFVNATLIAFQSTAARRFQKEGTPHNDGDGHSSSSVHNHSRSTGGSVSRSYPTGHVYGYESAGAGTAADADNYSLPMALFHAFQGVKAVTAASWVWLRRSEIALPIINAQPTIHLDITSAETGFFGHLLDDLEEELAPMASVHYGEGRGGDPVLRVPITYAPSNSMYIETTVAISSNPPQGRSTSTNTGSGSGPGPGLGPGPGPGTGTGTAASHNTPSYNSGSWSSQSYSPNSPEGVLSDGSIVGEAARARHAYKHAVAILNWAHRNPQNGACLSFPATVSRYFVDLLRRRTPRALCILACYFAMTKVLDSHWWLNGLARREVLGIVSLFNSDAVPSDIERRWWPHLLWAVRVAVYHEDGHPSDFVPSDVWNAPYSNFENMVGSGGSSGAHNTDRGNGSLAGVPGMAGVPGAPPPTPGLSAYGNNIDLTAQDIFSGDTTTAAAVAAASAAEQFNAFPFPNGVQ